jgi:hypothetical protein
MKEFPMNSHSDRVTVFAAAWSAFLIVGSAVGSLALACATPFAALAAVAAATLPPRLALVTTMGVWLANQGIGFAVLGYPMTASSLVWGPVLGAAALAATAAAVHVASLFDGADIRRSLAMFGTALAVQQGIVLAFGLVEGTASLAVAAGVSGMNVLWLVALAIIHRLAAGIMGRAEPAPAMR